MVKINCCCLTYGVYHIISGVNMTYCHHHPVQRNKIINFWFVCFNPSQRYTTTATSITAGTLVILCVSQDTGPLERAHLELQDKIPGEEEQL